MFGIDRAGKFTVAPSLAIAKAKHIAAEL